VTYFENLITSPITVNIRVGYGEVGGTSLGSGTLGEAEINTGVEVTTAQFKADLSSNVTSDAVTQSAIASITGSSSQVYVPEAEAKALGAAPANGTEIDASVGFAADPNGTLFTYDPSNRAVAGKYDFIGVVEHELSHALGRVSYSGITSALDLYRYSVAGVHASAGSTSYFSINGGTTNLDNFDTSSDPADWAVGTGDDANDAYTPIGTENVFSQTDVTELNVLGYAISTTPPSATAVASAPTTTTSTASGNTVSASTGLNAASLAFVGTPATAAFSSAVTSLSVALVPAPGIEEINGFQYGIDHLTIDTSGTNGTLKAFDTTVNGAHAIALASSSDLAHGIVLTGLPGADTAANLLQVHLSIIGSLVKIG
jgi:hypothetical protein